MHEPSRDLSKADRVVSDDDPDLDEEVDEASDESFPASDAPQWWSGPNNEQEENA
jgi:hypothetical protein